VLTDKDGGNLVRAARFFSLVKGDDEEAVFSHYAKSFLAHSFSRETRRASSIGYDEDIRMPAKLN